MTLDSYLIHYFEVGYQNLSRVRVSLLGGGVFSAFPGHLIAHRVLPPALQQQQTEQRERKYRDGAINSGEIGFRHPCVESPKHSQPENSQGDASQRQGKKTPQQQRQGNDEQPIESPPGRHHQRIAKKAG